MDEVVNMLLKRPLSISKEENEQNYVSYNPLWNILYV